MDEDPEKDELEQLCYALGDALGDIAALMVAVSVLIEASTVDCESVIARFRSVREDMPPLTAERAEATLRALL
jgi:hypothetical protein